jgi:hypothetical protein
MRVTAHISLGKFGVGRISVLPKTDLTLFLGTAAFVKRTSLYGRMQTKYFRSMRQIRRINLCITGNAAILSFALPKLRFLRVYTCVGKYTKKSVIWNVRPSDCPRTFGPSEGRLGYLITVHGPPYLLFWCDRDPNVRVAQEFGGRRAGFGRDCTRLIALPALA